MYIKQEIYGFVIEISRRGKATVMLTFEESPVRGIARRKHYYCCIDIGMYEIKPNGLKGFSSFGSFEIVDWFDVKRDIGKRNKLKTILGVELFNELVNKVSKLAEGKYVSDGQYIREAELFG